MTKASNLIKQIYETDLDDGDLINKALKVLKGNLDTESQVADEYKYYAENEEEPLSFDAWFEETYADVCTNTLFEIEQHIQNGQIIIYREITAPEDWQPNQGRSLGQYWSWDKNAAEAHWGSFGGTHVKYLLTGSVSIDNVDWIRAIAVNADPSSADEAEIPVNDDEQIKLIKWERR